MPAPFYIVGPTAVGKSEIAAAVARNCDGQIVSADAFQIYRGLDLLTAKPEPQILQMAPHHLISAVDPAAEMNAARFRELALDASAEISKRGQHVFVVGGSGMYVQALTHGLSSLPAANPGLRARLEHCSKGELFVRLSLLDPATAQVIDRQNKRRLLRAVEVCLLSGQPISAQRQREQPTLAPAGVFLFRERDELYARINERVESMFAQGVVDEVRAALPRSETAAMAVGYRQIRELLAGKISEAECIADIQGATRRYAKRQLTWFQRQTNFEPLNLSHHGFSDALEWISRQARLCFATPNV